MGKLNILGDPSMSGTYPDVEVDDIKRIAIFPPIGIARVGDSDIECFLAPEVPGRTSPPEGLKVGSEVRCPMFPRPRHTRSHALSMTSSSSFGTRGRSSDARFFHPST